MVINEQSSPGNLINDWETNHSTSADVRMLDTPAAAYTLPATWVPRMTHCSTASPVLSDYTSVGSRISSQSLIITV